MAGRPDEKRDPPRDFFRRVAPRLIIAFGFICLVGYLFGYAPIPFLDVVLGHEFRLFIKDVLFAIGSACIVSLIFGYLIELPDTTEYIVEKLSDLMFGEEYFSRIRTSLPELRRRIDKVLLGEAELASQYSLYNFVEKRIQALYGSSYRRNMHAEARLLAIEGSRMRWRQRLSYTYVYNQNDRKPPIIRTTRSIDQIDIPAANASKEELKTAFRAWLRSIRIRIGGSEYRSNGDDPTLLHLQPNPDLKLPQQHEVGYEFKDGTLTFVVEIEIPREAFAEENEVPIELEHEHLTPFVPGDFYFSTVNAPTEDMTCELHMLPGTRIVSLRYYWRGKENVAPETQTGSASASIRGWLVRGHGIAMTWFLPDSVRPSVAEPATKQNGGPDRSSV